MLVPWTLYLSACLSLSLSLTVSCQDSQQLSQGKRIMAIKSEIKVLFIWSEEGVKRMNEEKSSKEHVNFILCFAPVRVTPSSLFLPLLLFVLLLLCVVRFFNYRLVIN